MQCGFAYLQAEHKVEQPIESSEIERTRNSILEAWQVPRTLARYCVLLERAFGWTASIFTPKLELLVRWTHAAVTAQSDSQ